MSYILLFIYWFSSGLVSAELPQGILRLQKDIVSLLATADTKVITPNAARLENK